MLKRLATIPVVLSSFILAGASSCATSPVLPTIRPSDANKYELPFRFDCNGKDTFAVGTAHCQYNEGDVMKIRIKSPDSPGEIQVRSCRHERAMDIDGSKPWQEIEWVQYKSEDSCPIVMSVATKEAEVQLGKINPYVSNTTYPKLNGKGSFYCWESEKNEEFEGQSSCQVPTGIKVNGYLNLDPLKSGKFLVTSVCGLNQGPVSFLKGSSPIKWSLLSMVSQYCPVSAAVKYDDGSIEEYEVYIDFFDARYRALPPPIMGEKGESSYACAPQDFEFFDLNDHTKQAGLLGRSCIKDGWLDNGIAIGIAWDRAGRSSYSVYLKKGLVWQKEMTIGNRSYQLKAPQSPVSK